MPRPHLWTGAAVVGALLFVTPLGAAEADALAEKAHAVLLTNCYRCHGKDGEKQGGINYLLDTAKLIEKRKLVPGDPAKSRLYIRAALTPEDPMPPSEEKPRPSKDDLAVLEAWIKAGAPVYKEVTPVVAKRPVVTERDVYKAMLAYLKDGHEEHARFQRFFTLNHLHNDPAITESELRLARAALAKVLNSLSWRRAVVQPKPIDEQQTVLAFDLRELDWDLGDQWSEVLRGNTGLDASKNTVRLGYPYALTHDQLPEDDGFNRDAKEVYRLAGTKIPAVRADWFVAQAMQPPMYHNLLKLPTAAAELEKQLRVDVRANFLRDRLARAGFKVSGVSGQNRLVERHEAAFGAYWKSYDFKDDTGTGDLVRFPLGPANLLGKTPFAKQAFQHDGGEIIFSLPNGLHAYLLVNNKDERINEGPTEVVRDKNEFAGKGPIIVNGLSCVGCHRHGMIKDFTDTIRNGNGVSGEASDKVKRLFPDPKEMQRLLDADEEQFLAALERTAGHYLKVGADAGKDIRNFAEPVTAIAKRHLSRGVRVEDAALELGLSDPKELLTAVKTVGLLEDRGLKAWNGGGVIGRKTWEERHGLDSLYQEVARELKLGLPRNSD